MFKKYFQKRKKSKQELDASKIHLFSNYLLIVYNSLNVMSIEEKTKKLMFNIYIDTLSTSFDMHNRLLFAKALKDMYTTMENLKNETNINEIQIARELETIFRSEGSGK